MTHTGRVLEMGHSAEQYFKSISFCPGNYNMNPQIPERHTQRLFNALSKTVTRHWPSENRGGLDTAASDYQGIWRVQVSWLSHRNEPDCTGSEKLKIDMVERKCLHIFFFKIHVYWL